MPQAPFLPPIPITPPVHDDSLPDHRFSTWKEEPPSLTDEEIKKRQHQREEERHEVEVSRLKREIQELEARKRRLGG
jgi:hypothetical protein